MLLAIDVGNTNTVIAIYRDKTLLDVWRIASSHIRTVDEYWITVKLLCRDAGIDTGKLSGVIISSVVPQLTTSFQNMSRKYLHHEPIVVSHRLDLGLALRVDEPAQVGADRICNAVAARELYRYPLVVVDLGTATTFDVLDTNGDYIGGAIAPGLLTGAGQLTQKAAQLFNFNLEYPKHIIAKSTVEHMQSGIFVGHIAMIEGLCERIQAELGSAAMSVIATGGYAEELCQNSERIDKVNQDLTIEGLRLLFGRNG